jgi:hypothetical protein
MRSQRERFIEGAWKDLTQSEHRKAEDTEKDTGWTAPGMRAASPVGGCSLFT